MSKISFEDAIQKIRDGKTSIWWEWYDDCSPAYASDGLAGSGYPDYSEGDAWAVVQDDEGHDLFGSVDSDTVGLSPDVELPDGADKDALEQEMTDAIDDVYGIPDWNHYDAPYDHHANLVEIYEELYAGATAYLDPMRGFANEWRLQINPDLDEVQDDWRELDVDDAANYFADCFCGWSLTDNYAGVEVGDYDWTEKAV
jgi:hypothetical protein